MEFGAIGYSLYGPSAAAKVASCGLDNARYFSRLQVQSKFRPRFGFMNVHDLYRV